MRDPSRRCYLVRCGGDVAHISWVIFPGDRSRFLALGRGDVEITDSHTTRPYRNRGIYKQVLARILADMKSEGFRTAYAHVVLGNESSLRAMRAAGFRDRAVVTTRRLLGVYWTRSTGIARRTVPLPRGLRGQPWAVRR
jgi:RimJ/RimL family protein N-acetyltransferase